MKTKRIFLIVFLVFATGVAMAQPERFGRGGMGMPQQRFQGQGFAKQAPGEKLKEYLNLTDTQAEAVKKMRAEAQKALKPLKNELRELNAKHITLTTADKPDLAAINKSIEKIGDVKVEMAKIKAKQQVEFRALLTDEQLLKLDGLKTKVKDFSGNRFPQGRRRI
jgi:Spy/CpxP family protein refolding chaperone